jgi:DNA helicase-2/ATP-dependent DNA helicase PcrA
VCWWPPPCEEVWRRPEGAAHNPIATVKFEHNGEKKIMLNYAKLRILE